MFLRRRFTTCQKNAEEGAPRGPCMKIPDRRAIRNVD
jgi:hypothetical protein